LTPPRARHLANNVPSQRSGATQEQISVGLHAGTSYTSVRAALSPDPAYENCGESHKREWQDDGVLFLGRARCLGVTEDLSQSLAIAGQSLLCVSLCLVHFAQFVQNSRGFRLKLQGFSQE